MGFSMKANLHIDSVEASNYTTKIVVGYPDDAMHRSGRSMADLGELLSVGDSEMPARPHLTEGLEQNMPYIKEAAESYFRQKGKDRDASSVGEAMVQAVKVYVYSGALAPNAPMTIRKKGSDQPLVQFGDLMASLTYRVIKMRGSWRG